MRFPHLVPRATTIAGEIISYTLACFHFTLVFGSRCHSLSSRYLPFVELGAALLRKVEGHPLPGRASFFYMLPRGSGPSLALNDSYGVPISPCNNRLQPFMAIQSCCCCGRVSTFQRYREGGKQCLSEKYRSVSDEILLQSNSRVRYFEFSVLQSEHVQ